jgi:hypothetical protein
VCSALGLGIKASAGPNPLSTEGEPTAVAFTAGKLWETSYRLSVTGIETFHTLSRATPRSGRNHAIFWVSSNVLDIGIKAQ